MTAVIIITGFIVLVTILVGFFISSFNKLVSSRELIQNAKGQIAAQIESRWDALTNLIQATKQYATHESEVLDNIVNNRASVGKSSSAKELENAEDEFQGSLSRLLAITEAYPDLKASEVYKKTMDSVDEYEKNVRLSRMTYNDTVTKYNRLIVMIPTNIIASLTGHKKEDYFEAARGKGDMPSWQ